MIATEVVVDRHASRRGVQAWPRIAFAMFAVGWGANQFSPMLIVYRHELNLSAAAVAGLFAIYGAALIPALLIAGPLSDRYGRRPVVLPFVVLSPIATLLLILGPRELVIIAVGRALAGLCSGFVFGVATAWIQELSHGAGTRRAALALSAGFGFGPVVAAILAQWGPFPLRVPYIPHVVLGAIATLMVLRTREPRTSGANALEVHQAPLPRRWAPQSVRTWRFWLAFAPAAPLVFGALSLAIVVLPEDVTSAKTLSAGFAGLVTAVSFAAGLGIQPLARRYSPETGLVAGLCSAVIGTGLGVIAVQGQDRALACVAAAFLGAAYGLCLVSGLRQAEELASATDRGAVLACYYVLAYLGFTAPYLDAGFGALAGKTGALAILTAAVSVLTLWIVGYTVWSRGWQRGHQ